jgi:sec-independent protein translocase protein TatC
MDPRDYTMSFGDHLEELRKRLIWAVIGPIPILVVCLIYGDDLLKFLIRPAEQQLKAADLPARLLATGPAETFIAYLKVAFVIAVLISGPWILYQLWLFVSPGLYKQEKRFAYFLFPLSGALTLAGTVFFYYVLLPVTLYFFISFGTAIVTANTPTYLPPEGMSLPSAPVLSADPVNPLSGQYWINEPMREMRIAIDTPDRGVIVMGMPLVGRGVIAQQYRIGEYIGMVFSMGIVLAVAFQLPVVMLLANWVGILEAKDLRRYRKHALFVCAVAGAIFTPADPASMIMLMAPLYVLFEFGLVLMRVATPHRVGAGVRGAKEPPDAGDP